MTVVDDVKARVDLVDLVSSYASLQKAGKNLKAHCPFHTEKTPSFFVFPERGTWRCFGQCGTGGDAFTFIQKAENLTFGDALRRLGEQVGVAVEAPRPRDEEKERQRERAGTLLDAAADYFHRILVYSPAGEEARRYLESRGVTESSINDFRLGLSPNGREILKHHLRDLGYSEQDMLAAGVLIQPDEEDAGSFDRFRHRLMFPIADHGGVTVGFGARSLDPTTQPKYLNSPQTPLFDKSGVLYALDRSLETVRASGRVVFVEGYMDAIQAHQAGFTNVVAVMGTSLTERQVNLVRRSAKQYALALDPDAAGEEATRRSLESAWQLFQRIVVRVPGTGPVAIRQETPDLRIIALPEGSDPDDVIRADPADWERRVEQARPILDYLISWEASRAVADGDSNAGKLAVADRIFPLISSLENPFEQDAAYTNLSSALGVEPAALEAAVGRPARLRPRRARQVVPPADPASEPPTSPIESREGEPVEEHLLGLVLTRTEDAWKVWREREIPTLPLDCFHDPRNAELWRALTDGDAVAEAEALTGPHAARLRSSVTIPLSTDDLARALSELARRLLERRIKEQELEAALAVAGSDDGGTESGAIPLDGDTRRQFVERTDSLRELQRSRPGRDYL